MSRLRSAAGALLLAFAVFAGQQAAALHALRHATEELSRKSDSTLPHSCDQCFPCAQLAAAAGATVPSVPAVDLAFERPLAVDVPAAPTAPLLAFRSRAPPVLL